MKQQIKSLIKSAFKKHPIPKDYSNDNPESYKNYVEKIVNYIFGK